MEYTDAAFNAHFRRLIKQMPLSPKMQVQVETEHMLRIRSEVKDYLDTLAMMPKPLASAPVQLSQNRFALHRSMSQIMPKPVPGQVWMENGCQKDLSDYLDVGTGFLCPDCSIMLCC